ncbi:MAG: O-antigen ligase family protein [Candidatus Omnitrophica bacterium]|nr:O-antigen ligase family protein [Candidatus Omnitrophota bacterium]
MRKIKLIDFLKKATLLLLCMVIFSIPISIALTNITIGLALIFWLINKILNKDLIFKKTPINIFLILLILVSAISMVNSSNIVSSLGGMQKLAKYIFLFFIIVETVDDKDKLKRIVFAWILGLSLVSIDGFFQYLTGKDFIRGYPLPVSLWKMYGNLPSPRIKASMHNPNDFACYLISSIPLILPLFLYYTKRFKKMLLGLIFVISFFCMFHTQFRGAGLAFVVIVILLSIIKKDIRLAILLLIFLLSLPIILPKPLLYWLVQNINPYDFFIEDMGRRRHWQTALEMVKKHPFVGVGINTFSISYIKYKDIKDPFVGFYAHNSYLHLAGETGLIGLMIFIWMLIVITKNWINFYRKQKDKNLKDISLGIFLGWLGFLIAGLLESSLQISNLAVLFWFITGVLVGISNL